MKWIERSLFSAALLIVFTIFLQGTNAADPLPQDTSPKVQSSQSDDSLPQNSSTNNPLESTPTPNNDTNTLTQTQPSADNAALNQQLGLGIGLSLGGIGVAVGTGFLAAHLMKKSQANATPSQHPFITHTPSLIAVNPVVHHLQITPTQQQQTQLNVNNQLPPQYQPSNIPNKQYNPTYSAKKPVNRPSKSYNTPLEQEEGTPIMSAYSSKYPIKQPLNQQRKRHDEKSSLGRDKSQRFIYGSPNEQRYSPPELRYRPEYQRRNRYPISQSHIHGQTFVSSTPTFTPEEQPKRTPFYDRYQQIMWDRRERIIRAKLKLREEEIKHPVFQPPFQEQKPQSTKPAKNVSLNVKIRNAFKPKYKKKESKEQQVPYESHSLPMMRRKIMQKLHKQFENQRARLKSLGDSSYTSFEIMTRTPIWSRIGSAMGNHEEVEQQQLNVGPGIVPFTKYQRQRRNSQQIANERARSEDSTRAQRASYPSQQSLEQHPFKLYPVVTNERIKLVEPRQPLKPLKKKKLPELNSTALQAYQEATLQMRNQAILREQNKPLNEGRPQPFGEGIQRKSNKFVAFTKP